MLFRPEKKVRNWLVLSSLFLLLCSLLVEVRGAYEEPGSASGCLECHEDAFDEDLGRGLIHQPCQDKRCIICHCSASADINGDDVQARSAGTVPPVPKTPTDDHELTVIDVHLHSDYSHSFIFTDDEVEEVLLVELWQGKERQKVEKIALLPLAQLPRLIDDKRPPRFSDIRVEKVERGLSSSAVISWKTDEPATTGIRYGLKKLNRNSFPHGCLVRNHRVTLSSLKTNRQYQFSVVSTDLFGNQTVSDCLSLSTKKAVNIIHDPGSDQLSKGRDCSIIGKQFFNIDGRYLALLELSQRVSVSIGVEGMREPVKRLPEVFVNSASEPENVISGENEEDEHRYLLGEVETTIDNCFTCHKGIRKEMSHPVNVLPTPGMQVPKEYPLLSNGKMSCMTCHVRHAGEHLFRLVRDQGKQFCEGCHAAY